LREEATGVGLNFSPMTPDRAKIPSKNFNLSPLLKGKEKAGASRLFRFASRERRLSRP